MVSLFMLSQLQDKDFKNVFEMNNFYMQTFFLQNYLYGSW